MQVQVPRRGPGLQPARPGSCWQWPMGSHAPPGVGGLAPPALPVPQRARPPCPALGLGAGAWEGPTGWVYAAFCRQLVETRAPEQQVADCARHLCSRFIPQLLMETSILETSAPGTAGLPAFSGSIPREITGIERSRSYCSKRSSSCHEDGHVSRTGHESSPSTSLESQDCWTPAATPSCSPSGECRPPPRTASFQARTDQDRSGVPALLLCRASRPSWAPSASDGAAPGHVEARGELASH